MPNGITHPYQLDESIFKGYWVVSKFQIHSNFDSTMLANSAESDQMLHSVPGDK